MGKFNLKGFKAGDNVKVTGDIVDLSMCCVGEFKGYVGVVSCVNRNKTIMVDFSNGDRRLFSDCMLTKLSDDSIDTYCEWLDSPEGDEYADAMNEAYGDI